MLHQLGVIQKLEFGGGEARYDGTIADHLHVRCVQCSKVQDIAGKPLALSGFDANDFGGYKIVGQRFEYLGICPDCQKNENK
jgi:Fe2+ or Zn2+ uptake regulation protein